MVRYLDLHGELMMKPSKFCKKELPQRGKDGSVEMDHCYRRLIHSSGYCYQHRYHKENS